MAAAEMLLLGQAILGEFPDDRKRARVLAQPRSGDMSLRALRYWQSAASSSDARIEQYRELVSEISKLLGGSKGSASG